MENKKISDIAEILRKQREKKVQINFTLSDSTIEKINYFAENTNGNKSEVVDLILQDWFKINYEGLKKTFEEDKKQ